MISNPAIAALIRDNKTYRLPNDIHTGSKHGMLSLEASLMGLYKRGLISRHEVLARAQDYNVANQLLSDEDPAANGIRPRALTSQQI